MKFKISKNLFLNEINKVLRIIAAKTPTPVLTGVLINVSPDQVILIGTDGNVSIKTVINQAANKLEIEEVGTVLIKARFLTEVIRKVNSDEISINSIEEENILRINAGNFKTDLNLMDATDYPDLRFDIRGEKINISRKLLEEIVYQVGFAVAASDNESRDYRFILTGINFDFTGQNLITVATDSFRLSKKVTAFKTEKPFKLVIPLKILSEVTKILEKSDNNLEMYVDQQLIIFKTNTFILTTKLIEGQYPDVSRVIPTEFETSIEIKKQLLINAIDRASVLSHEIMSTIVKVAIDEKQIEIKASVQETGQSDEIITEFKFNGQPLQVAFSAKYALEALRAIPAETIRLNFVASEKPIIINGEGYPSLMEMILPIRTI